MKLKMISEISKRSIAFLLLEEDGIFSIELGDSELNMPAFMSTTETVQVDKEIDFELEELKQRYFDILPTPITISQCILF